MYPPALLRKPFDLAKKKKKYDLCYLEDPSLCKVTKPVRLAGISQNKRSIYLSKNLPNCP